MRSPLFLVPVFFCFVLLACTSEPGNDKSAGIVSQYHGVLPQVMETDSGLFHGISLGMTMDEVKKNVSKKDTLMVELKNYLQFEGRLAPSKEYAYECNFDEKGLRDLTLDIFLHDEPNGDSLYSHFSSYFTQKYGQPIDTNLRSIWIVNTGKRPARIILEEDDAYMYGKLTVTFVDKTFDMESTPDSTVTP